MDATTTKVRDALLEGKAVLWGGVYVGPNRRGGYAVCSEAEPEEVFRTADEAAIRAGRMMMVVRCNKAFG